MNSVSRGRHLAAALIVTGIVLGFTGCDSTPVTHHTVDCVYGYHYPPGRTDTCVRDN